MEVAQKHAIVPNQQSLPQALGYEQNLRAIGQALEGQGIGSFGITPIGSHFLVQGTGAPVSSRGGIRFLWSKLPNFNSDRQIGGNDSTAAEKSILELQFTLEDIQRLELEGRARRVDPHQMANASSVSQVLRCLGAYLNHKRARLIKLTRQEDAVAVEYVTSLGNPMKESFSAKDLYDMWVRMYMQRAARTSRSFGESQSSET
jgi:hypothetical protein